jgi:hypothetical protein
VGLKTTIMLATIINFCVKIDQISLKEKNRCEDFRTELGSFSESSATRFQKVSGIKLKLDVWLKYSVSFGKVASKRRRSVVAGAGAGVNIPIC